MGSELRFRGASVPDHTTSIWSAKALFTTPDIVFELHRDYIRAGADVITLNNYAVTPVSLDRDNMGHRVRELTLTACELALKARRVEGADVLIAGSLPPLNTSYRADQVGTYDELVVVYRQLAGLMAPHVDLFICETMTKSIEARAASIAGLEVKKPVWASFCLNDAARTVRGGESVSQALAALDDLALEAVLINCSAGLATTEALIEIAQWGGQLFGAYINPFLRDPPEGQYGCENDNFLNPVTYGELAESWYEIGARIFGGCCGTGPKHVGELKRRLINPESPDDH